MAEPFWLCVQQDKRVEFGIHAGAALSQCLNVGARGDETPVTQRGSLLNIADFWLLFTPCLTSRDGKFYVSTWLGYGTQIFGLTLFWMFFMRDE